MTSGPAPTPAVTLRPMRADEWERWKPEHIRGFAATLIARVGLDEDEALVVASKE